MRLARRSGRRSLPELLSSLRAQSKKIVLCLGRWEPGCYKNSQAAFEVMEKLTASYPDCVLLVLEEASNVQIPKHLNGIILPVGFPDDEELNELMKEVDLGLSLSLWEGFNLPLAEMQWIGKPALVFAVGAHPEVVAHPWYLCVDTLEMSKKAAQLMRGQGLQPVVMADSLKRFRDYFRWSRFIDEFAHILTQPTKASGDKSAAVSYPLLIDVTSATKDPSNPGVIRVARRLGRELQVSGQDPLFITWDEAADTYVLPTAAEFAALSRFNGPLLGEMQWLSEGTDRRIALHDVLIGKTGGGRWLLMPETMMERSFRGARRFARHHNIKTVAIFYDSIPVLRPDMCNEPIRNNHRLYMNGLAECDIVVPISQFSAKCLEDFWRETGIQTQCRVIPDVLPSEFGGAEREQTLPEAGSRGTKILCISTLEPRKNHRNLIQACLLMAAEHPRLDWTLTLVGNRYEGAFEIAEWVQDVCASEPRIRWLGVVDDPTLNRLYQECSFTVYPSVIEGFGLPIVESIWHGRPCICYNQGVMAELARDGGCVTTDVTDPAQLSQAIYALAIDDTWRIQLSREAINRPVKTWRDYVADLCHPIAAHTSQTATTAIASQRQNPYAPNWQAALYPHCLLENWQMNESERIAISGLLARHRPFCSIEVGTYHGGSLSVISQYSRTVFSIDIDAAVPSRLAFPNVNFLIGQSGLILPILLRELDDAGTSVEFILIDGDHSASGVAADIASVLAYVPKRPLFVLLHDSFNPDCRRGMSEAAWDSSPYCHWIDLDFVPGRIVETPGPFQGDLWGGLAAAYFCPAPRTTKLQISKTADKMFQFLLSNRAAAAAPYA